MELTLQSFLLFLGKLVSFFNEKWGQTTRRLWYIFAFLRSRFSSRQQKKGAEIRRGVEPRPVNPPTTAICASRLPPTTLTPIVSGDTPVISSRTPVSIQVRKATILDPEDPLYETQEDHSPDHLGVDGHHPEGSSAISRSHNPTGHHGEYEYAHATLPQGREDPTSSSLVIPSRPNSRPPSRHSHRPPSEYSYRSPSYLTGAEAAAQGYLHGPPSPGPSSVAGSVASQVYRAPRPTTRVRMPSPMRNTSRRRARPATPVSGHQSVHEVPPEVPALSQTEPRISISIHHGPRSTVVSIGPATNPRGRLRPMIGVDRYEKHKIVVIEDAIKTHVFPPVTTQFVR